ncbi:hypothetical protein D3C87_2150600 [compost metagenome]
MVRLEVERQRNVVQGALEAAKNDAERSRLDAERWEKQARLAETRAAVLAGKSCLPKEVVDAIKDIR